MSDPDVSIVVANWQGADVIARCLSSLQLSARASGRSCELICVDDASTDESVALIRERFPRVRLVKTPRNRGFAVTVMRGVSAARGRVVVLCNNDLSAKEPFIGNLTRWFFEDAGEAPLFAVSARTMDWYDGAPNQVCMGAVWRGGRVTPAYRTPERAAECLFVQAGAAAYDRALFLRLGGLARLFEPGYWEDYDLSYRAAKAGYRSLYDPEAVALHIGGGSMTKRYGREAVEAMKARNHLLFEWANLTDPGLLMNHGLRLPVSVAQEWTRGNPRRLTRGFFGALRRLPRVLRHRRRLGRPAVGDRELLKRFEDFTPSY
ncbi:MAG: glycosyltransferase family 2 protein [Sumerlaeia bacterium]